MNQRLHPNPKCSTGRTNESTVAPEPQVFNWKKRTQLHPNPKCSTGKNGLSCTRTPSVQPEIRRTQLHPNPKCSTGKIRTKRSDSTRTPSAYLENKEKLASPHKGPRYHDSFLSLCRCNASRFAKRFPQSSHLNLRFFCKITIYRECSTVGDAGCRRRPMRRQWSR